MGWRPIGEPDLVGPQHGARPKRHVALLLRVSDALKVSSSLTRTQTMPETLATMMKSIGKKNKDKKQFQRWKEKKKATKAAKRAAPPLPPPPSGHGKQPAASSSSNNKRPAPSEADASSNKRSKPSPPPTAPIVPPFAPPRWELHYDNASIERCVRPLLSEPAIGIDVEWRPNFVAGRGQNPVALLQLCSRTRCVLVPIKHLPRPLPPALGELLRSPRVWKLGVGVSEDAQKLLHDCKLQCEPTLEVGELALRLHNEENLQFPSLAASGQGLGNQPGLARLAFACGFDLQKPKKLSRSNWEVRPLSDAQQRYAAYDAYCGVWIARCLHALHARKAHQNGGQGSSNGHGGGNGGGTDGEFVRWLTEQSRRLGVYRQKQSALRDERKKERKKEEKERRKERDRAAAAGATRASPRLQAAAAPVYIADLPNIDAWD